MSYYTVTDFTPAAATEVGGFPINTNDEEFEMAQRGSPVRRVVGSSRTPVRNRVEVEYDDEDYGVVWGGQLGLNENGGPINADPPPIGKTIEDYTMEVIKSIKNRRAEIVRLAKRFVKLVNLKLKQRTFFVLIKTLDGTIEVTNIDTYLEAAFDISLLDAFNTLQAIKRKYKLNGGPRTIDEVITRTESCVWFAELVANEYNRAKSDHLTQTQKMSILMAQRTTINKVISFYKR